MNVADSPSLDGPWWWLSFADASRPKGQQFLGVAIVRGLDMTGALSAAWAIGCNPGGQVEGSRFPDGAPIPDEYKNRLLDREACRAFDLLAVRTP